MEYQRKLEILAGADFSGWRMRFQTPGFGNNLQGIHGSLYVLASTPLEEDKRIFHLQSAICFYYTALSYYEQIPFKEIDPLDGDFGFLFGFREKLQSFGKTLEILVEKTVLNGYKILDEWEEYRLACLQIQELKDESAKYRNVILKKHRIEFSQPAPNQ